jgi:hypothetical protein
MAADMIDYPYPPFDGSASRGVPEASHARGFRTFLQSDLSINSRICENKLDRRKEKSWTLSARHTWREKRWLCGGYRGWRMRPSPRGMNPLKVRNATLEV